MFWERLLPDKRPKIDIAERNPGASLNDVQDVDEGEESAASLDDREDLQKAIISAIRKHAAAGKSYDMGVVGTARDQRNYVRGFQYSSWNEDAQDVDFNDNDAPYERTFNVCQAYCKIFVSTFMGASPKVEPEPDENLEYDSIRDASRARDYEQVWRKHNDIATLQMEIGRLLFTDGRIITISVDTPKGQRTRLYGVLESRAPSLLRGNEDDNFSGQDEEANESPVKSWPMFETEDEYPLVSMKRKYGKDPDGSRNDVWRKLNSGSGDSYYRNARLSVKRMASSDTAIDIDTGEDATGLCTITCSYMRPEFYEHLSEDERADLEEMYPNGFCLVRNGDTYLESFEFEMDAHVDVIYAIPSDGANGPAIMQPLMPVQDSINTSMNLIEETFDHGIPTTYYAQETNIDTLNAGRNMPGGSRKMVLTSGRTAEQHFYATPELEPSQALTGYAEQLQGPFAQFVTGLPPAIQGFGDQDQKTASGYAQMRQMALGQMAIVWKPYTSWYTREMTRDVRLAANSHFEIKATLDSGRGAQQRQVAIEPHELQGFKFTNTSDENFPETYTERRNALMTVMQDPDTKKLIMSVPDNIRTIQNLTGLQDLIWPGEDSSLKQLQEIAEMETQGPIPDPAQMPAQSLPQIGAPPVAPPLTSSIPVSKYDNDEVEEAECLRWINSPEGQEAKRTKPNWYQDVCLHCDLHTAQKAQKAAANAPPPEEKPPSVTVSVPLDKFSPEIQQQVFGQFGVQVTAPPVPPEVTA